MEKAEVKAAPRDKLIALVIRGLTISEADELLRLLQEIRDRRLHPKDPSPEQGVAG